MAACSSMRVPNPDPLFVEVRDLMPSHVHKLGNILQIDSEWKKVMGEAASTTRPGQKRFSIDDIQAIERYSRESKDVNSAFEVFVDEWGTMGKKRPNVGTLLLLCLKVGAVRAASYISQEILKRKMLTEDDVQLEIDRVSLELGRESMREAAFDIDSLERQLEGDMLLGENNANNNEDSDENNSDAIFMPGPHENAFPVPLIPYSYLSSITCDFGSEDSSRKIGSGGFADVYLGITQRSGHRLAIKRLKEASFDKQKQEEDFNHEVGEVSKLKNNFILKILGYCNQTGHCPCLVYPYMENGTLDRKLRSQVPLAAETRMKVLYGVIDALSYLHSWQKALIHRDIKSSNILLDENLSPKVADFGLLRYASTSGDTHTVNVKGTPHYMAPEAMRGDINPKVDVFSYGAVMLDVLTGLKPVDPERENRDLISHVQEELSIGDETAKKVGLLDKRAGWEVPVALNLFNLSLECLREKPYRPESIQVRTKLIAIIGQQEFK